MLRNQKGASLPYVIGLAAIIAANTYYFLGLEKNSISSNNSRKYELSLASEKRRIGTFLSESSVCGNAVNFGGKTFAAVNAPGTDTLSKNATPFLVANTIYANGQLMFKNYRIAFDDKNPAAIDKQNSLYVTYHIMKDVQETNIKRTMRIPLRITVNGGGQIISCYADAQQNMDTIENTLVGSCEGNGASAVGLECFHNVNTITCPPNFVLNGITSVGNTETYSCATFTGGAAPCANAPMNTYIVSIGVNNTFTCDDTDPSCPGGTIMKLDGAAPGCAATCPALTLYQGMDGSGSPICYTRPAACPPGQFASEISPSGVPVCQPYSLTSKTCGPGMFATRVNAAGTTAATVLGCTAYSKSKSCPSPGPYTFIRTLTSATPTCHTYTY